MAAHPSGKISSRVRARCLQAARWGNQGTARPQSQIDSVAEDQQLSARAEEIGCEFKDFDKGSSISTAASRDARSCGVEVGEDRIAHWHELEAGFAGRQPLPEVLSRT